MVAALWKRFIQSFPLNLVGGQVETRLVDGIRLYDGAIHMRLTKFVDGADSYPIVRMGTGTADSQKRFHQNWSGNISARLFEISPFDGRTGTSYLDDTQNFRTNERHFTVNVGVILISVERLMWTQQSTVCSEVQRNFWTETWNHHETFWKLCT